MNTAVTIPTLETERLILRAPRMDDTPVFQDFLASERAHYVGGPVPERRNSMRAFGHVAGLWVLRGYSVFVAELRDTAAPIGMMGPWYPLIWPEPEYSWSLWDGAHEGQGYIAEGMAAIAPWFWETTGLSTTISVIDRTNARSAAVARRMGASVDPAATAIANAPGSPFHDPERGEVDIFRHNRPAR